MALTAERLREIVFYDPDSGIFTWRIDRGYRGSRGKAGQRAGSFNHTLGYRVIGIDAQTYYEHRLAVLYVTGAWPAAVVDHRKNGDGFNNKWANLRPASKAQNSANTDHKKPNATSALRGVSWHRGAGKWQAHLGVGGKSKYLGLFLDEAAAHQAYRSAALAAFGEFADV